MDDPFPLLNDLRERAPVYDFNGTYLVSRYDDVRAAMAIKDHSLHRNQMRSRNADEALAELTPEEREAWVSFWNSWGATLAITVGSPHERLRRIAHRGFTPGRIAGIGPSIRSYADELLDELAAQGDLVDLTEYAQKLTLRVIIGVLGTPQQDGPLVLRWVERAGGNFGNIGRKDIDTAVLMDAHAANREFCDYIEGFLDDSRAGRVTRSELADSLLDAEQDERMTTDELVGMFMLLLSAGHDTTKNLVSLGTLELMRHRDQWERLCADPSVLATTGVDELIRWVSPLLISFRLGITGHEVQYRGVTIPPDTVIMPMVGAANRDPDVFADPDVLDLGRRNARNHLGFGFGSYFCLGAALARLEGEIAFERLSARFPDLELAGEVGYRGSFALRGLTTLPVSLGRDRGPTSGR